MPEAEGKRVRQVVEEIVPTPQPNPQEKAKEILQELDRLKTTSKNTRPKKEKATNLKLIFLITVLTALIVGFVSGGVYVYFSGLGGIQKQPEPTSTPSLFTQPTPTPRGVVEPTPSPSPEPEETLNLSAYKVSVLNGSGKIGEAGKVSDLLKKEGFTVSNVANASRYDYEDTLIQVQDEVPASVIALLQKALSSQYSIQVGDKLASTSKYEIVITVGSK